MEQSSSNLALNLAPFSRWTLRMKPRSAGWLRVEAVEPRLSAEKNAPERFSGCVFVLVFQIFFIEVVIRSAFVRIFPRAALPLVQRKRQSHLEDDTGGDERIGY